VLSNYIKRKEAFAQSNQLVKVILLLKVIINRLIMNNKYNIIIKNSFSNSFSTVFHSNCLDLSCSNKIVV